MENLLKELKILKGKSNHPNKQVFQFTNNKNEEVEIWTWKQSHDKTNKQGLMNIWVRNRYLPSFINETWSIEMYVKDLDTGFSYMKYSPQIKSVKKDLGGGKVGSKQVINFDYYLEATEENLKLLIQEIYKLANK